MGLLFERAEVGIGIAAEAGACGTGLAPAFEGLAQRPPRHRINPAKVAPGRRLGPRADAGHEPHGTPQHRAGRGRLASGGAPLVVALRTEELFEGVVGPRQVGPVGSVEQPGPVASRNLAEVVEGCPKVVRSATMTLHGGQQPVEASPDLGPRLAGGVGQEARGSMHEDEALLHLGPERRRAGERPLDQEREPRERT